MAYTIYKADGTPIIVPDNIIDRDFYNPTTNGTSPDKGTGTQLVGRNAIDYGAPVAQNFLQLSENFCGPNIPGNDSFTPLQGMLWFKKESSTTGGLYVRMTSNGSGGLANWAELIKQGDAVQALYSDLAERYEADAEYSPGTVVELGGNKEITATTSYASEELFGVISTQPGIQLNSGAGTDKTHPYVAMVGRVPVMVEGTVRKGQRLVSSHIKGIAISVDTSRLREISVLAIIGRALENKTTDGIGPVLAAVGVR